MRDRATGDSFGHVTLSIGVAEMECWINGIRSDLSGRRSNTFSQTVMHASGKPAASRIVTPFGTGRHCAVGARA
jgi:hypothetical protein